MSFSVESFRAKLEGGGGPAFGDRYHVAFTAPGAVSAEADAYLSTETTSKVTNRLSWLCDTINIPSRSLTTTEFRTYGLPVKRPYGSVYTESQMEFLCTRNMGEKKFFDAWLNYIFNNNSYDIAYYDDEIRHLDTIPQSELIELLEVKSPISISKIKPTIVAIPTIFSTHQDHVQAYKVSMTALRENPQKIHKLPHMVVSYESPEYHHWSAYSEFGRFSPDYYLSLSKLDVDKKVKCLNIYQSQIREGHRDGEKIYSLAKIRGSEIGSAFAESYHIHRFFIQ